MKLRDAIETQARNSRVSTGHSSVAIHYSFNADTWREILRDFRDFTRLNANCLDIAVTM